MAKMIESIDIDKALIGAVNSKGGQTKVTIVFNTKTFDSKTLGDMSKLSDEDIVVNVHMDVLATVNKRTGAIQDKDQLNIGGTDGTDF